MNNDLLSILAFVVQASESKAKRSSTLQSKIVAIFKAISEGEKNFSKIAVVGGKDGVINGIFAPCGVCRQVLREFCSDDFQIILGESEKDFKVVTLKELLPLSFSPDNVR